MSSKADTGTKKAGAIGVKKEGKGYHLKSANPRPGYFKSLELAVNEVAATCERRR